MRNHLTPIRVGTVEVKAEAVQGDDGLWQVLTALGVVHRTDRMVEHLLPALVVGKFSTLELCQNAFDTAATKWATEHR